MKRITALLAAFALVLATPGARLVAQGSPSGPLTVFAAASLTEAFRELGQKMEHDKPGLAVRFSFAGSQQLALQMEQGAKADVFASADQRWMGYVDERHLLAEAATIFVRNRLVVIIPKTNPGRIGRLEDLAKRGVKFVVAAEAVPVGKYSREALQQLTKAPGFPADYDRRVLANTVSQEENVKAVVAKVQLGEADAGIVYRSDVTPAAARVVRTIDIPDAYNVLASYPIATVKGAGNVEAARAFLALVLSADGQRVLQRHRFIPVNAPEPAAARQPTRP